MVGEGELCRLYVIFHKEKKVFMWRVFVHQDSQDPWKRILFLDLKRFKTLINTIFLRCLVQLQYSWVILCLKLSSFANLV